MPAAQEYFQRALSIREHVFASTHPVIASSYVGLASLDRINGNAEKARDLLLAATSIDENAYGVDHPTVARDCSELALSAADLRQWKEAIQWMRRAWAIRVQRYGPRDKRSLSSERWLAKHDSAFAP